MMERTLATKRKDYLNVAAEERNKDIPTCTVVTVLGKNWMVDRFEASTIDDGEDIAILRDCNLDIRVVSVSFLRALIDLQKPKYQVLRCEKNDDLARHDGLTRAKLKASLARCNEKQQHKFKQMYSPGNLDISINEVVDGLPPENLDWAMQQVESTLNR